MSPKESAIDPTERDLDADLLLDRISSWRVLLRIAAQKPNELLFQKNSGELIHSVVRKSRPIPFLHAHMTLLDENPSLINRPLGLKMRTIIRTADRVTRARPFPWLCLTQASSLQLKLDGRTSTFDQIMVSKKTDSRPVWISRKAALWGFMPESLDINLAYDPLREPQRFSAFILDVKVQAVIENPITSLERSLKNDLELTIKHILQTRNTGAAEVLHHVAPKSHLALAELLSLGPTQLERPWLSFENLKLAPTKVKTSGYLNTRTYSIQDMQQGPMSDATIISGHTLINSNSELVSVHSRDATTSGLNRFPNSSYYQPTDNVFVCPRPQSEGRIIPEAYFVGSDPNWYHFFTENAPTLNDLISDCLQKAPVILPAGLPPQIVELCEIISGLPPIHVKPYESIHVERLHTRWTKGYGEVTPHIANQEGLVRLQRVLLENQTQATSSSPTQIYLRRSPGLARPLQNDRAVTRVLLGENFSIVDPASLTLREQAALLGAAKCVVLETGAAFTSLIFCRPGTLVIELQHPFSTIESDFWPSYCRLFGLNFWRVQGRLAIVGAQGFARDGFYISHRQLRRALKVAPS